MFKYHFIFLILLAFSCNVFSQETDEQLAIQYFSSGEYEKALGIFETLYQKKPGPYYYNYILNSYIELKQYSDAEKFIRKAMKQDKNDVRVYVDMGYLYKKSGNENKAITEYEDALKKVALERNQITNLANAFLIRNEQEYAIKTYLKGRNSINDYSFGLELAAIYERQLKYEEMMKEYLDLLEFNTTLYLTTIQSILQTSLSYDPEGKKNEALKSELLRRIQLNPSQTFYSEMLLWHAIQQKDFETAVTQAKAIDRRLKQNGMEVFNLGNLALSNEAYDVAVQCFEYVILKGENNYYYTDSRVNLLHAEYLKTINSYDKDIIRLENLEHKYLTLINEYGIGQLTLPLVKDLSYLQAFYMQKTDEAKELLEAIINRKELRQEEIAQCKLQYADILLMTGDVWEATLLYSQVEKAFKNAPIASEAKFKNARLSYYINEFEWAKAQLDVLKASTSKLIANDAMELSLLIADNVDYDSSYVPLNMYARADLLSFQNLDEQALIILDSILVEYPAHLIVDDVLYKKAHIYLKKMDFLTADSILNEIVQKYSYSIIADDALYQRAGLYETKFKNSTKAMELYQELLVNYPASLYTVDARKKYRILRGDFIN